MSSYKALGMTSEASNYIEKREDLKRNCKQVFDECEKILALYEDFLNDSERCQTKSLTWGIQFVGEFKLKFVTRVLMNSYKVFNESHLRYEKLLRIVQRNNPEWLDLIVSDHEDKLRKCKVSVFPFKEALTA